MKKLLIPSLLVLFAAGMSQARAGVSIDVSIGSHHPAPVVVQRPPVVISRPPVVVMRPPVVDCEQPPVYVRECERAETRYEPHGHYRHEDPRRSRWHR